MERVCAGVERERDRGWGWGEERDHLDVICVRWFFSSSSNSAINFSNSKKNVSGYRKQEGYFYLISLDM